MKKKANGGTPYRVLVRGYIEECHVGSTKDVQEFCSIHGIGSDDMQCYTRAATKLVDDGSLKRKGYKYHENGKKYMVLESKRRKAS